MKNKKPYVSLKIIPQDGKVISVASRKTRRIFYIVKANNSQNCIFKVSVRYGPGIYNKGIYQTKEYTVFVLEAFLEP